MTYVEWSVDQLFDRLQAVKENDIECMKMPTGDYFAKHLYHFIFSEHIMAQTQWPIFTKKIES